MFFSIAIHKIRRAFGWSPVIGLFINMDYLFTCAVNIAILDFFIN